MKYAAIIFLFLSLGFASQAQETETLFANAKFKGAFGGPLLEISQVNGDVALDVGGGGAIVINNFFFGGYGLGREWDEVNSFEGKTYYTHFAHGGLWLGYTYKQHKALHPYADVKLGWGHAGLKEDRDDKNRDSAYRDEIFAVTPQLGLEFNLSDWLRIGLTGGYRWVFGYENTLPASLDREDFESPLGAVTFRIGAF